MTRVVRNAALFCVAGILVVSAALASVPDPSTSSPDPSHPDYLDLSGTLNGLPDNCSDNHCNLYTYIIRDFSGAPVVGATVVVDFSNCSDMQLSCTQVAPSPFVATNIGGNKVQSTTDGTGTVRFTVDGGSKDVLTGGAVDPSPVSTLVGVPCAQIFANGVPMRAVRVAAFDINSLGSPTAAVNAADAAAGASAAAKAAAGRPKYARFDVSHDGNVTSADASTYAAMAAEQAAGVTGVKVTGPYCP